VRNLSKERGERRRALEDGLASKNQKTKEEKERFELC